MPADSAEMQPNSSHKLRLLDLRCVDGRTRQARAVRAYIRAMQRELARKPTATERKLMERAAVLQAIAEDARVRLLQGDPSLSHEDATRADNCARRAVRDLRELMMRRRDDGFAGPLPDALNFALPEGDEP